MCGIEGAIFAIRDVHDERVLQSRAIYKIREIKFRGACIMQCKIPYSKNIQKRRRADQKDYMY